MGTGQCFRHVDSWTTRATAHADMGQLWTGTTRFLVRTADDTTTTTTANTTTAAKERRGSELGLALRGGGRLLGLGVALRCSGSRPEAGGHGLGYQRETRKRSRSPVGWASVFSHSSTLARHLEVDGVNWANGAEATQQDVAHVFKRGPVIPFFPRRFASIEPSRMFVVVVAAAAAERELRILSANLASP